MTDDIAMREKLGSEPSLVIGAEEQSYSLVSDLAGSVPLWTNLSNSFNVNLSNGESVLIEFGLNATGPVNTSYDIFGVLDNGDRTEFTTIEIIKEVLEVVHLELVRDVEWIGSRNYSISLVLNNLNDTQTPLNKSLVVYVFLNDVLNVTTPFGVSSSLRYNTSYFATGLSDVFGVNGSGDDEGIISLSRLCSPNIVGSVSMFIFLTPKGSSYVLSIRGIIG